MTEINNINITDTFTTFHDTILDMLAESNSDQGTFRPYYSGLDVTLDAGSVIDETNNIIEVDETVLPMNLKLSLTEGKSKVITIGVKNDGEFDFIFGEEVTTGTEVPSLFTLKYFYPICNVTVNNTTITALEDIRFVDTSLTPNDAVSLGAPYTVPIINGEVIIDCEGVNKYFIMNATEDIDFSVINIPTDETVRYIFRVVISNDATIDWSNVVWAEAAAPTEFEHAIIKFISDGTNLIGTSHIII